MSETLYITEKGNFFLHVEFDSIETALENQSQTFMWGSIFDGHAAKEFIFAMDESLVLDFLDERKIDATEVIPYLKNVEPA